MPAITPASNRFIINLQMLGNAGVTGPLEGFQDDVRSFDQPMSTRGAVGHLLEQFLLQGTDMKRFRLWKRHESSLLHGFLSFILSHPPALFPRSCTSFPDERGAKVSPTSLSRE